MEISFSVDTLLFLTCYSPNKLSTFPKVSTLVRREFICEYSLGQNAVMDADTRAPNKNDDISTQLVVSRICETLREKIVSGAIPPGSVINSVELARQFGTSRTPIREALLVLSQDGLISMTNYRRPRVSVVTVKAIHDLYGFRETVHAYIAVTIVQRATDQELWALKEMATALMSTTEVDSETQLSGIEAYIGEELRLCGNGVVIDVLNALKYKIRWFRRVGMPTQEQFLILAQDRLRAAEAYAERDALLAEAINRSMVRKGAVFCEQSFLRNR
jgi:DNA-binding GntR family transcriptional regulator